MKTSFPAALLLIWVVVGVPSILLARMAARRISERSDDMPARTVNIFQSGVRYLIVLSVLLFVALFILYLLLS
jgi:hypothetical protein